MIYNTVSIQSMYRRLYLLANLKDDNEMYNIYEFFGWAIKEIGHYATHEKITEKLTVEGHRVMLPCGFFRLYQICYNGVPMKWSNKTAKFQHLVCEDCFNSNTTNDTGAIVRFNNDLRNTAADYLTTDGVQTVNINQIVKVAIGHTAGGVVGDYYQRINTDVISTNLNSIDYVSTSWVNISDQVLYEKDSYVYDDTSPSQIYSYQINPGYINTEFEEGEVTISYEAIPTDENGFFKIPDDPSYKNALEYFVKIALIKRGYKFPEENLAVCKGEWVRHRDMARSNASWPTIDQMDLFAKRWIRPFTVLDRAQNFFKNEF